MAAAIVLFLGGLFCGLCMAVVGFFLWIKTGLHLAALVSWFVQALAQLNRNALVWIRTEKQWISVKPDDLAEAIIRYGDAAGLNTIKEQHD